MDGKLDEEIKKWEGNDARNISNIKTLFDDFSKEFTDDDYEEEEEQEMKDVYDFFNDNEDNSIVNGTKYNDFCTILVRNLKGASLDEYGSDYEKHPGYIDPNIRCVYLNIWLHFYTNIRCIPVDDMNILFNKVTDKISNLNISSTKYTNCPLESYNRSDEKPEGNITNLISFLFRDHDIPPKLFRKNSNSIDYCDNKKNERAKIYSELNRTYCNDTQISHNKINNFCNELETFKNTYTLLSDENLLKEVKPPSDPPQSSESQGITDKKSVQDISTSIHSTLPIEKREQVTS
ncbi:hypothetical protein PCYB_004050, partial [Plasmodium cynomolgi strain B]